MEAIMHELSIAMSILEAVEEETANRDYGNIHAIRVRIGALSGVVPESLLSAYKMASENTRFAQTRLLIEAVPIRILCAVCQEPRPVRSAYDLRCAECKTASADIVEGRELNITSLEVGP
jgi:hydrogenase nickel incorporation protein HypA/HybF